ncbi:LysR family transcriptional regulator [Bacilliculturomica massiliensis]|uniref:LysR family transcriptional regulator n=1 Tax=Bacilliculturomica massiliensis TaxID=1917867 RepID=UPI0013EF57D8|nr:LysR family transcriptional regulator [Bacilliculturomica massiliensis]
MLDLKIVTFLKVVETKSYTAAADVLHMTQPAVTQQIHRLEEHYGCRLVEFSGRSFRLTEGGRALYEYALLQQVNERLLISRIDGMKSPMRIGATLSAADYYLQPALNSYILDRENKVRISVANTETLLSRLVKGQLDCAFVEGNFDRELFAYKEFCRADFRPVAASSHPLAGRNMRIEELYTYPLLLRESGSGTRDILENYLREQNDSIRSFDHRIEMSSFVMIKKLLRESNAISFMYEAVAEEEVKRGELCFLQPLNYNVSHPLHFVWLKNGLGSRAAEKVLFHMESERKRKA